MSAPGTARILVVEDNDTLRRGIARALRETWDAVEEAAAGDEAIARLGDARGAGFDVVLSDLRLPGADGVAVLRAALERDARMTIDLEPFVFDGHSEQQIAVELNGTSIGEAALVPTGASTPVARCTVDDSGQFRLDCDPGTYDLLVEVDEGSMALVAPGLRIG